jgi:hypothetical protein
VRDHEISVIETIAEALGRLSDGSARRRVLAWAQNRFGQVPQRLSAPNDEFEDLGDFVTEVCDHISSGFRDWCEKSINNGGLNIPGTKCYVKPSVPIGVKIVCDFPPDSIEEAFSRLIKNLAEAGTVIEGILVERGLETKVAICVNAVASNGGLEAFFVAHSVSICSHKHSLYIIQNRKLHRVNPADGSYEILRPETDWGGLNSMTAHKNHLYIIQNRTLHRVNPNDGTYVQLKTETDWSGFTAMTTLGDRLYVIQNRRLHRVNPDDGSHVILDERVDWGGFATIAAYDNRLFIIQNGKLHRVNPENGSYIQVRPEVNWSGATSMGLYDHRLYVIQNRRLHRVNPDNGSYVILDERVNWSGSTCLAVSGNRIYVVQNRRLHSVDPADGAYVILRGDVDWGPIGVPLRQPAPRSTAEQEKPWDTREPPV